MAQLSYITNTISPFELGNPKWLLDKGIFLIVYPYLILCACKSWSENGAEWWDEDLFSI